MTKYTPLTVLAKSHTPCFLTSTTGISILQVFVHNHEMIQTVVSKQRQRTVMKPYSGGAVGHRSSAVTLPIKKDVTNSAELENLSRYITG